MTPRATMTAPRVLTDREVSTEIVVNGRTVTPGVEVSVAGIGRCAFVRYVKTAAGAEWVDLTTKRGYSRTRRPDEIRTVHTRRVLGVARA